MESVGDRKVKVNELETEEDISNCWKKGGLERLQVMRRLKSDELHLRM